MPSCNLAKISRFARNDMSPIINGFHSAFRTPHSEFSIWLAYFGGYW
jgi:hypothetical protein